MGDDSQEADKGEQKLLIGKANEINLSLIPIILNSLPLDRIPAKAMQSLIESLAARVNYGIELSDVSATEAEGLTETPVVSYLFNRRTIAINHDSVHQNLQMLRWEVHDFELIPAELETKLQRRKTEREEVRRVCR